MVTTPRIYDGLNSIRLKTRGLKSSVPDMGSQIPPNPLYKAPIERRIYMVDADIIAQGILFDGVPEEQYLVLERVNGGKRWKWSTILPEYKTRKVIWKL